MCFRRLKKVVQKAWQAAFTRQLSEEEMQDCKTTVIKRDDATLNIYFNKEDTLMIEKLIAYRTELEEEIAKVQAQDNTAEIEAQVAEYRQGLINDDKAAKEALIAKLNSDVECLNRLIRREQEAATEAVVEQTEVIAPAEQTIV